MSGKTARKKRQLERTTNAPMFDDLGRINIAACGMEDLGLFDSLEGIDFSSLKTDDPDQFPTVGLSSKKGVFRFCHMLGLSAKAGKTVEMLFEIMFKKLNGNPNFAIALRRTDDMRVFFAVITMGSPKAKWDVENPYADGFLINASGCFFVESPVSSYLEPFEKNGGRVAFIPTNASDRFVFIAKNFLEAHFEEIEKQKLRNNKGKEKAA